MFTQTKALAATLAVSAITLLCQQAYAATDPVVLTFSTVGDSRQDPTKPDPTTVPMSGQDALWLQNSKAFTRILRTINSQKAQMLVFNGDMIMGYGNATTPTASGASLTVADVVKSDLLKFYQQYGFWRGMVAPMMEIGTYVVPVPGNHEVQCKTCGTGGTKAAQLVNENAWGVNMSDLILDTNRFTNIVGVAPTHFSGSSGVMDGLTTDQSKLTYSFDVNGSHFVVINTDPVGKDATAPNAWLANDLAAAAARGETHFFVFGHKPAWTYAYAGSSGLSGFDVNATNRDTFWALMETYGATYFCGHEHIYNMSKHGNAYQVLVGSGGSPFDQSQASNTAGGIPTDRMYAWATVSVHQSGAVDINAYGFNDAFGPTQLIQTAHLAH